MRILLPVDRSESSRCAAAHIAQRISDGETLQLHVLSVQRRPRADARLNSIVSQQMIDDYVRREGSETIQQVQSVLDLANVRYETQVAFGDIAQGIVHYATEHHCEQIVMGTRGTGALRGFVMGSVATRVIQLTDLPVTLVTESCRTHGTSTNDAAGAGLSSHGSDTESPWRTLVALDGSENSERAVEHVIGEVRGGAKRSIVLLNVQTPYPAGGAWDQLSADELAKAYQEDGDSRLRVARDRLDIAGIPYLSKVALGAPAAVIAKTSTDMACHQIVMGTRGMGASGNLFMGSIAVKVVHLADVPVTLVK